MLKAVSCIHHLMVNEKTIEIPVDVILWVSTLYVMKHCFMLIYMLYREEMVRTRDHRGLSGDWYAYLR